MRQTYWCLFGKNAGASFVKSKSHRAIHPNHKIMRRERIKMEKSFTLARERRIGAKARSRKSELHIESGFQEVGGQAESIPGGKGREYEEESVRKVSPEPGDHGFAPSVAKPK